MVVGVAAALFVGVRRLVDRLEDDGLIANARRSELVGQVELGGRARLHADGSPFEVGQRGNAQLLAHHDALAVVEGNRREVGAQRGVARERPRGVAEECIALAGLQHGEALGGGGGADLVGLGVAKDGGSQRAAEVHIKAGEVAFLVQEAKAGQVGVADADHVAAIEHGLQRAALLGSGRGLCGGGFSSRLGPIIRGGFALGGGFDGGIGGGRARTGGQRQGEHQQQAQK